MIGADLSEVWSDYKPKKKKKKIKNLPINPNHVDSMDSNVLDEKERVKLLTNDRDRNYLYNMNNSNIVEFENPYENKVQKINRIDDDPDYKEFMEYKKNKSYNSNNQKITNKIDEKEQLNELILYIFTGFFIIMLYDNIYKLGKKSY